MSPCVGGGFFAEACGAGFFAAAAVCSGLGFGAAAGADSPVELWELDFAAFEAFTPPALAFEAAHAASPISFAMSRSMRHRESSAAAGSGQSSCGSFPIGRDAISYSGRAM